MVATWIDNTSAGSALSKGAQASSSVLGPDYVSPPPPKHLNLDAAKAALEQATKRLEGQLATKTATEARAIGIAQNSVTILAAVGAATLIEIAGRARLEVLGPALLAIGCLLVAIFCAYRALRPREFTLPGRLPSDLWSELVSPDLAPAQFIAVLVAGTQRPAVKNEIIQRERAIWLRRGLVAAWLTVPLALISAAIIYIFLVKILGAPANFPLF